MLSTSAFNAFLKTLEEPPKHVIFILATTEKHKIIPTILSRCQIFEFKRITPNDIQQYLANIAKEQGVTFEEEALHLIGQKADGAMRDALSIYDRMCSFCNNNLTVSAVAENLNILDHSAYLNLVEKLIAHEIPEALIQYDGIVQKGFDGEQFISGLASHLRNLYLCKDPKTIPLIRYRRATTIPLCRTNKIGLLSNGLPMPWTSPIVASYPTKTVKINACMWNYALCKSPPSILMEKKKGSLIPTSFFLQSKSKTSAATDKTSPQTVAEPKAEYHPKKTVEETPAAKETETTESSQTPALPSPTSPTTPKISIHPKDGKQVSSFSLASIRKKKEWEQHQKPAKTEAELPSDPSYTRTSREILEKLARTKNQKKRTKSSLTFSAKPT